VGGAEVTAPTGADVVPALRAVGLTVGYARVPAVSDVDLEVGEGEIVGLLGPNGAGKTTTLLGLAGEITPMAGYVELFGRRCPGREPLNRRARQGLGYVPEQRAVFRKLSVAANLMLGLGSVDDAVAMAPELAGLMDRKAGLLSGGEQQIMVLARALAAKPRVLLVDELSLGLAPFVVKRMVSLIKSAAESGTGILAVDQSIHTVLRLADRAYVLRRGRVVLEGTASDLRNRLDEIQAAYLAVTTGARGAPDQDVVGAPQGAGKSGRP
jgi:branched-chain amino acid transport system ATP-binding protein